MSHWVLSSCLGLWSGDSFDEKTMGFSPSLDTQPSNEGHKFIALTTVFARYMILFKLRQPCYSILYLLDQRCYVLPSTGKKDKYVLKVSFQIFYYIWRVLVRCPWFPYWMAYCISYTISEIFFFVYFEAEITHTGTCPLLSNSSISPLTQQNQVKQMLKTMCPTKAATTDGVHISIYVLSFHLALSQMP